MSTARIEDHPSRARAAIKTASDDVGFLDRFGRIDRYDPSDTISHMVSTPEIGDAWRISVPSGGTAPSVVNRAFRPAALDGLFYLSGSTPTPNGKFALVFDWQMLTTAFPTGSFPLALNVSFGPDAIIRDNGNINTDNLVHINIRSQGVLSCDFGIGAEAVEIPCVNAVKGETVSQVWAWNASGEAIPANTRQLLIFEVDGDDLYITAAGLGTLHFTAPGLSDMIGASTHWWWEPDSDETTGSPNKQRPHVAALHGVYSAENILSARRYFTPENSTLPPGRVVSGLISQPNRNIVTGYGPPSGVPVQFVARASGTTTVNGLATPTAGLFHADQGYIASAGLVGTTRFGRAPIRIASTLTTTTSKTAAGGADQGLFEMAGTPQIFGTGDSESWEVPISLVGSGNKRIWVRWRHAGSTYSASHIIDSGSALNGISGSVVLRIRRQTTSAASHMTVAEIAGAGITPIINIYAYNNPTANRANPEIWVSHADDNAVVMYPEHYEQSRVVNRV